MHINNNKSPIFSCSFVAVEWIQVLNIIVMDWCAWFLWECRTQSMWLSYMNLLIFNAAWKEWSEEPIFQHESFSFNIPFSQLSGLLQTLVLLIMGFSAGIQYNPQPEMIPDWMRPSILLKTFSISYYIPGNNQSANFLFINLQLLTTS